MRIINCVFLTGVSNLSRSSRSCNHLQNLLNRGTCSLSIALVDAHRNCFLCTLISEGGGGRKEGREGITKMERKEGQDGRTIHVQVVTHWPNFELLVSYTHQLPVLAHGTPSMVYPTVHVYTAGSLYAYVPAGEGRGREGIGSSREGMSRICMQSNTVFKHHRFIYSPIIHDYYWWNSSVKACAYHTQSGSVTWQVACV